MQPTKKLYDIDAYLREFTATVLSCEESKRGYALLLDQTAFFPEEGGQKADGGFLNDIAVTDVQLKDGYIFHYCAAPIAVGETVTGKIDFPERYRKMQNHTGEHIACGIIHTLYGFDNVGFHLNDQEVTFDISGELNREDLNRVETLANEIIYRNLKVSGFYPSAEELRAMQYRAKLDLTEGVRIVTIGDVDSCACCAPHVKSTGEVGIIKFLDFIRYKGGVRIHMLCGSDAVADYRKKHLVLAEAATLLSAKQHETDAAVAALLAEKDKLRFTIHALTKELATEKAKALPLATPYILAFTEEKDVSFLREMAIAATEYHGVPVCLFLGSDGEGYAYAIASSDTSVRPLAKPLNLTLKGKGGGNEGLIQGSIFSSKEEIMKKLPNLMAEYLQV